MKKVLVRATDGRPVVPCSICFFPADYLYQHPMILVKIFVELDICVSVPHESRGKYISVLKQL